MRRGAILTVLLSIACGAASSGGGRTEESAPALPHHPCTLELGVLELPVAEGFALAAGDGACLLVDENREARFVSVAALMDDEEGAALLRDNLREFLRSAGVVGEAPRFTRRSPERLLDGDVELHEFVATPPGLEERAGFAVSLSVAGGVILLVGLSDTPESARSLWRALNTVRFTP